MVRLRITPTEMNKTRSLKDILKDMLWINDILKERWLVINTILYFRRQALLILYLTQITYLGRTLIQHLRKIVNVVFLKKIN